MNRYKYASDFKRRRYLCEGYWMGEILYLTNIEPNVNYPQWLQLIDYRLPYIMGEDMHDKSVKGFSASDLRNYYERTKL